MTSAHAHHNAPPQRRLLWRYLWLWAMLMLLAVWGILTSVSYYTGMHEADEINDGQLVAVSQILLRQEHLSSKALYTEPLNPQQYPLVYAPELRAIAWENGQVVWDSHGIAAWMPAQLRLGLQTLKPQASPVQWRACVTETTTASGTTRRVAVLVDKTWRQALGRDIAIHLVRPAIILLPIAALLLAWAIRRGLAPLKQLSHDVAALDLDAGHSLPAQQPFQEFSSTVHAIHALTARLQSQLERERQFTADVAHELRTPLTSLILQAQLAQSTANPSEQAQALHQLTADAQRAARILTQLLDLVRAQKLDGEPPVPVDLCPLAQQVVSAHARMAHERGQTLALQAPDTPVWVHGHATLLELALRNLVDNALRHTPQGTTVEVRVECNSDGSTCMAVQDDGARAGAQAHPSSGMGVGLGLVQRIAQAQGAVVEHVPGAPAQPHRIGLRWSA